MLGLGSIMLENEQHIYLLGDASQGFFDETDHLVAYANRSAYGEPGNITKIYNAGQNAGPWSIAIVWKNSSGSYNIFDAAGQRFLEKDEVQFEILSPEGLIAMVAVAVVGGGIGFVALSFFGGSDVAISMVMFGTLLLSIWTIFSWIAYPLLTSLPLIGGIFWFLLTIFYALGILQMVRGNGT